MRMRHRSPGWRVGAAAVVAALVWACGGAVDRTAPPPPTANPSPTPAPPATATARPISPGELAVLNTAAIRRGDGSWRLLGEVHNGSDTAVTDVTLNIEWFDAAGNRLGSDTGYVLTISIAPGETSPFLYHLEDPGVALSSFAATAGDFSAAPGLTRASLDVRRAALTVDRFGDFHCTGELENNSSAPVRLAGLAAAVRASGGALVSADSFWAVARYLAPGGRTPYRISPPGFVGAAAADHSCSLYVDAEASEPAGLDGLSLRDANGDGDSQNDSVFYVDSFGSGHLVGEVVNSGGAAVSVQLVAGLYDAAGNVIDADFVGLPVPLAPGEALPFDFTTFGATNYSDELAGRVASFRVQFDPSGIHPAAVEYVRLPAQAASGARDSGTLIETVDVRNDQPYAVDFAYVIARVADPSGKIVGYNYTSTEPLAPGSTTKVGVTIFVDPAIDPATLSVTAIAKAPKP